VRRRLVIEIIVAGLVFAGLHQFAEHSASFIAGTPNALLAILIFIGACGLFAIRKYLRFGFGLVEILIGGDAIWTVVEAAPRVVDSTTRTQFLLQVAGGAYFVVRGLDNIDQSRRLVAWLRARRPHAT
jgi:hypothetical protein